MGMSVRACVVAALLISAGCGDDGDQPPPPPPSNPATPRPGAANPNAAKAPQLPERLHIEDRVACAVPDRPSDPKDGKCDLKAPSCGDHLYCLPLAQGSFCEPCPERDGIRHAFKERDFTDQNRDPFQSYLLPQFGAGGKDGGAREQIDPTKKCPRETQMIATNYSYSELRLVGIVALGTQRKVLMMGGPLGYIIKRGDCVGKEKAYVKDIGTGYITFVLDPDAVGTGQRAPEEISVQLNPKQLAVVDPDMINEGPRGTVIAPVVAPPAVLPSAPATGVPVGGVRAPAAGAGSAAPAAGSGAGSGKQALPPVELPGGKQVPAVLPPTKRG